MTDFLSEEHQTLQFYLNSMSMFLRESYGMRERCQMYFDILTNVAESGSDFLLKYLNIYSTDNYSNPNYFEITGIDRNWTPADSDHPDGGYWPDLIGSIFGLYRTVWIPAEEAYITLSNYEFILYIQATIAKNSFDGTLKSLRKIYTGSTIRNMKWYTAESVDPEWITLNLQKTYLTQLGITYFHWSDGDPNEDRLKCRIILPTSITSNIEKLFKAGYLTVESLGITYSYGVGQVFANGYYGDSDTAADTDSYYYGNDYQHEQFYVFGDEEA